MDKRVEDKEKLLSRRDGWLERSEAWRLCGRCDEEAGPDDVLISF
jgi:hypothetical protein